MKKSRVLHFLRSLSSDMFILQEHGYRGVSGSVSISSSTLLVILGFPSRLESNYETRKPTRVWIMSQFSSQKTFNVEKEGKLNEVSSEFPTPAKHISLRLVINKTISIARA